MSTQQRPRIRLPLGAYAAITIVSMAAMAAVWGWLTTTASNDSGADTTVPVILGIVLLIVVAIGVFSQGKPWQMLVNMSPTALLMIVFPIILQQLGQQIIIVLMVAVTVPWASSAAVMPVYEPLVRYSRDDRPAFYKAFARLWPTVTIVSLIPLVFFTTVMSGITGWGFDKIWLYIVGLLSNLIFAHSLIPAQETRRYSFVFAGWFAYAAGLFLFPHLWFVVPLMGVIPQLVLMGRQLSGLFRPMRMDPKLALVQTIYGFLIGSVLWADKFFLIALHPTEIDIFMVYVALVPIVVALAMYYTTQYPVLESSFQRLIRGVNETPLNKLDTDIVIAQRNLAVSAVGTICVSTVTGLGIMLLSPALGLQHNLESLLLFLLPPMLLSLYLGTMQLSQMQRTFDAAMCGGIYVLFVAMGFVLFNQVVALIIAMVFSAVAAVLAVRRVVKSVADAPYELFWQKAVAW